MKIKRIIIVLIAAIVGGCTGKISQVDPPAVSTPRREVREMIQGTEFHDPYRWLEGDDKGEMTPEVSRWTDEQNARTRTVLDNLPGRSKLESRIRELMELPAMRAPTSRAGRYFYLRREGTQNQAVLYMREGVNSQPKVLVDPNTMDAAGLLTIDWYVPSEDAKRIAVGVYRAGDENTTGKILDIDSGKWLSDEIKHKVEEIQWTPDGSGLFYNRLSDPKNPYSRQIRFHRLGDDPSADALLFEQYKEGPLATTWGPSAEVDRQCKWMALGYWTGTSSNDLWAINLDEWRRTGQFVRKDVIVGADAQSQGQIVGDTLFMQTNLNAPRGRLVAVDMRNPSKENWREIVPERKDATLAGFSIAKDVIALQYERNAYTQIMLVRYDGTSLGELTLPGIGTADISTEELSDEAFISFSSFNTPQTIYRITLPGSERTVWHRLEVPVDSSAIEVEQVWYPSKDGTKISMFLVHRKGLKLDGNNPTLLYGYGGFGISMTPYFSATQFTFFEAGGVFAVANLRGGGEYGLDWHKAGMLEKKQNVFDDFIAAVEWLIQNKYTNPAKLAISGGSNGGLLVGAAMVQRPELFAAVDCAVPLLDMLRYQRFLMARYWVPEYGSAEDPTQFQFLSKYSPYQQVRDGVKYPAVRLSAGENDSRVHPLHARKMAASLQAATASDPQRKPILLWIERDSGHGAGKPLKLRVRDETDRRIFVMWQLGML